MASSSSSSPPNPVKKRSKREKNALLLNLEAIQVISAPMFPLPPLARTTKQQLLRDAQEFFLSLPFFTRVLKGCVHSVVALGLKLFGVFPIQRRIGSWNPFFSFFRLFLCSLSALCMAGDYLAARAHDGVLWWFENSIVPQPIFQARV